MDYTNMSLDELKDRAKELGLKVGNIGKDKLIAKITEAEATAAVLNDTDDLQTTETPVAPVEETSQETVSVIDSITATIDELDEADDSYVDTDIEELPLDAIVPVKSITFGGLTYKSPTTNAVFRWNQIGQTQYLTIAQLNEMNNYNRDFLNKPLVILLDDKAVKQFRLMPVYENVAKITNLKKLFASDIKTIEATIDNALRVNMRDILISKVRQMIKNKALNDINIIHLLERKLQFDIQDDIQ